MATVTGGSGDDTLSGTSDNDTIDGGGGHDSIQGGGGHDSILGGTGNDTIDGGDGNDTIYGNDGDDVLLGGAGDDLIFTGAGNDFVDGGDGNDTIQGSSDNETLIGGDGDDLIYAADGDDRIEGGAGNDTLYGHAGADVFVVSANSGFNSIEDYSAGEGDLIAINYPGITTYSELQPYLSDDGNWGTLISLPDGSVTQVKWLNYDSLSAANFTFEGPVCFLKGTMIDTATGCRPVETLGTGDLIRTLDHGLQPLKLLSTSRYRFPAGPHKMKPIRIKPHSLGQGHPKHELLVSPQHRIAIPQTAPRALVAARQLLDIPGVSSRPECRSARYYHLLFERHELVNANGTWTESLLVTSYSVGVAGLRPGVHAGTMTPARPLVRRPSALADGVKHCA